MSLPYDAEVEFLESIGTQWINTGINCNSNYILEVEAQGAKGSEGILGARKSSENSAHTLVYPKDNGAIRYTSGGLNSNIFVSVNISLYNIYKADYNKLYINDALVGTSSRSIAFTLNIPYYLFAVNTNGSVSNLGAKKIKMCRIWDGASLLLDLIPVRKGQVGYMYDKVSGQLFGNAGTGDFILGSDKTLNDTTMKTIKHKFHIGDIVRHQGSDEEHLITGINEVEQVYCVDEDNPMHDGWFPFSWESKTELVGHKSVVKHGIVYK